MATFAPVTDRIYNTNWGRPRSENPVGMWVHHQANGAGADAVDYMVGPNSRDSHPTYATDKAANVYGIVHPNRVPSSTFYENDFNAVAIELANIGGAPDWRVPDAALEKLAQIIAHHASESSRAAHPIELNKPGQTQKGFYVGWHSQVRSTACPGPYVVSKLAWVVNRANEIKSGNTKPKGFLMALSDQEQNDLKRKIDNLSYAFDKIIAPALSRLDTKRWKDDNKTEPAILRKLDEILSAIGLRK